MIKKILDWILGKSDKEAKPTELSAEEAARLNKEIEVHLPAANQSTPQVLAPVVVEPKYKQAELEKMKKAELEELVKKHNVEVKSRSTKSELITALKQV
jgi:hypothetical protein